MGNVFSSPDYKQVIVDGGLAQIKDRPRQTDASGTRQRIDPNEYDPVLVGKLVAGRKLAPFYEGKFDEKGDGRSVGGGGARSIRSMAGDRASIMTTESKRRAAAAQQKTKGKATGRQKGKKEKKRVSIVDQKWLTTDLCECPICLLWYPKNMNYTKCCKKPICTVCFVSMKRPTNVSRLISCPFCRSSNLTVLYRTPESIVAGGKMRGGVVCERIRPPRIVQQTVQRPVQYRYNTSGAAPAFAQPRFATSNGARATTPYTNTPTFTFYSSPTRLRPAPVQRPVAQQVRPSAGAVGGGQQRQLTPEEIRMHEERALNRAIRLSMLEY